MKISDLARELQAQLSGPTAELEICAGNDIVTNNIQRVVAGGIFVAVRGGQFDGNSFVAQAVERGVAAVISTDPSPEGYPEYTGYWLRVADARIALAKAATPTKMMMTMTRSPTRRSKLKIGSTPIRTLTPGTIFLKKAVASVITVLR